MLSHLDLKFYGEIGGYDSDEPIIFGIFLDKHDYSMNCLLPEVLI